MNTYQVLLMRPIRLLDDRGPFNDLQDLQYLAVVDAANETSAMHKALDELFRADNRARNGIKHRQEYTVLGYFVDGKWWACFNQPRWKGH